MSVLGTGLPPINKFYTGHKLAAARTNSSSIGYPSWCMKIPMPNNYKTFTVMATPTVVNLAYVARRFIVKAPDAEAAQRKVGQVFLDHRCKFTFKVEPYAPTRGGIVCLAETKCPSCGETMTGRLGTELKLDRDRQVARVAGLEAEVTKLKVELADERSPGDPGEGDNVKPKKLLATISDGGSVLGTINRLLADYGLKVIHEGHARELGDKRYLSVNNLALKGEAL
jgi:hypothetical protein